jgi:hypothetical protein
VTAAASSQVCKFSFHRAIPGIKLWNLVNGYITEQVSKINTMNLEYLINLMKIYSAFHSRVAPENVGLQKEQKYNTFACHTRNEVRLCVLGICKKEVGNTKR